MQAQWPQSQRKGRQCTSRSAVCRTTRCSVWEHLGWYGVDAVHWTMACGLLQTRLCLPGLRDLSMLASHGRNLCLGVHTWRSPVGWLPRAPASHDTFQSRELHSTEFLRSIARIWLRTFEVRCLVWSPAAALVHWAAHWKAEIWVTGAKEKGFVKNRV